ncbi:alpha/beta-Hydrolases superfamily protein [Melia azedarach]|uniref:Alpha/beta-Hydrolases superfamily protein n=1 Tax=Melia azedarach TaxID=155640 RepID=A0ACC1X816_MELAZ|nr:alpha/beta-Hydrolases superfamily protein [Melia azedarach]
MMALKWGSPPAMAMETKVTKSCGSLRASSLIKVVADGSSGSGFPSFIPKEIEKIRDPFARSLCRRIVRLPVLTEVSESCIMSSCVKPQIRSEINPIVLLHSFDSSCLEWRSTYPLLEKGGLEAWAVDVLGWGFSDLERLPPCNADSKRYHLYQLWKSYVKRPMILVGPSLGAAVAIDFAVNYPEAVEKMVLINPSVYAEGTGNLAKLPKIVAYAGVSLLKSFPLRLYANLLTFNGISLSKGLDWTNVGRLHCHLPWWKDATVDFMASGGYNVVSQIKQVRQEVLIIFSEHDQIVSNQLATRLQTDLPNATMRKIPGCSHLPHVDKPNHVAKLITTFSRYDHS